MKNCDTVTCDTSSEILQGFPRFMQGLGLFERKPRNVLGKPSHGSPKCFIIASTSGFRKVRRLGL